MLVTLEAQRDGRKQRQQEKESGLHQLQPSVVATSPTVTAHDPPTSQRRKPIVTLSRKAPTVSSAAPSVTPAASSQRAAPPSLPIASSSSSSSSSQSQPQVLPDGNATAADSDGGGVDGLSSRLDQLALDKPLTPLQALAARPRGSPASASANTTRPATDTAVARRLVMGALGIRNERSEEEREKERQARREHQRMRREQLTAQKQQAEDAQSHAEPSSIAAATGENSGEAT